MSDMRLGACLIHVETIHMTSDDPIVTNERQFWQRDTAHHGHIPGLIGCVTVSDTVLTLP